MNLNITAAGLLLFFLLTKNIKLSFISIDRRNEVFVLNIVQFHVFLLFLHYWINFIWGFFNRLRFISVLHNAGDDVIVSSKNNFLSVSTVFVFFFLDCYSNEFESFAHNKYDNRISRVFAHACYTRHIWRRKRHNNELTRVHILQRPLQYTIV